MENMYRFVDVEYEGIKFEVCGHWEEFQKATRSEPSEGGCFDNEGGDIKIDGVSIYEMLTPDIATMLIEKAEEELREL